TDHVAERCATILESKGFEVASRPGLAPEELCDLIAGFHGLIVRSATRVTAEVIACGKNLRVIGRAGAGIDNIDVNAATQNGIAVMNAAAANTIAVVEHTFALMLALIREIPQAHITLVNGKWQKSSFKGVELFQKTLGLIGLGKIGSEVAKRAKAFDMHVLAYDPFIASDIFNSVGVEASDLSELLRRSDFISIHVPLSQETKYLIGEEQFNIGKPNLRLVNTSRGGIVDEMALYRALKSHRIAAAALDVFEKEPPGESPLFGLNNFISTPHLGASTFEAQQRVAEVIAENVANFLLHKRADNIVNQPVIQTS
ncbi:MAG: hydroxyacid dehydrogenase, partial [bacterium]